MTLFHAAKADRNGNVWIGLRRELMTMSHASAKAYATVEEIVDDDLLEDPEVAAGTIPGLYVTGVAPAERGAWPLGVPHLYERDAEHLAQYAEMAKSQQGFDAYTDRWVFRKAAAE